MDVLWWIVVKGSYVLGLTIVLALLALVGFGLAAAGSALLGRVRGEDPVSGSTILNLLAATVFGVLLAISTSEFSAETSAAVAAFASDMWYGFGADGLGEVGSVLWGLAVAIVVGATRWAAILPQFLVAIASDLGARGNFAIFLLPSLICLVVLAVREVRRFGRRGFMGALAHVAVFINFAGVAAFTTWWLMSGWNGVIAIFVLLLMLGGSSNPARYVVLRV